MHPRKDLHGLLIPRHPCRCPRPKVSPNADAPIEGEWSNGDPASTLAFDTTTDVVVEGSFGCPNVDEAGFTATYAVTNADDPASPITVSG